MHRPLPISIFNSRVPARYLHVCPVWQQIASPNSVASLHDRASSLNEVSHVQARVKESNERWGQARKLDVPKIAVVGGGLTGLSTAYFLTKKFPDVPIDIYEASDRVGGWLETKQVPVAGGLVNFDQGPQTIRPPVWPNDVSSQPPFSLAGFVMIKLIDDLDILNQGKPVLYVLKSAQAAKTRYIYYPDHLVRLPAPSGMMELIKAASSLVTEPIFDGLLKSVIHEWGAPIRPPHIRDETVADWLMRRLGRPNLIDNVISAGLHGIYAGDIYKLSMRSLLPSVWAKEKARGKSFGKSIFAKKQFLDMSDRDRKTNLKIASTISSPLAAFLSNKTSTYNLSGGMWTLAKALERYLRGIPNVTFKLGHNIKFINYESETDSIAIHSHPSKSTTPPETLPTVSKYLQTISTISSKSLVPLIRTSTSQYLSLSRTHSVTVLLINLYFRSPPSKLMPHTHPGFGYLLPRSVPSGQNPESALGVIFNAFATPYFVEAEHRVHAPPGTQMTVMLGGHWWDAPYPTGMGYPSVAEGVTMARSLLQRHLGIHEEPEAWDGKLNRDCIPQYEVGHAERMAEGHGDLKAGLGGRLTVVGGSYGRGVGLNDAVFGAWEAVERLSEEGKEGVTGLEWFVEGDAGSV